jgi:protein-tyrosine-phosphatase
MTLEPMLPVSKAGKLTKQPSHAAPPDSSTAGGKRTQAITGVRTILKEIIPEAVLEEIQLYRKFKGRERSLYLKLRVGNRLRRSGSRRTKIPAGTRSFLFLCFGNIMRSPMCEALMRRAVANLPEPAVRIVSAGLSATPGTPAHEWSIAAARDFGISLEHHRATLVSNELLEEADVIFVMDYRNLVQLLSRYPVPREKVFMLGEFATPKQSQIKDPYYGDQEETRRCYAILHQCIVALVDTLFDAPESIGTNRGLQNARLPNSSVNLEGS